jgi:hypothetical protein
MKFLRKIGPLESRISNAVDSAARRAVGAVPLEPIEAVHAIIATIEGEIQAGGRGKKIFPFTLIEIVLSGPSAIARARLKAVVQEPPTLATQIRERLETAGCEIKNLAIEVRQAEAPGDDWTNLDFHVLFSRGRDTARRDAGRKETVVPEIRLRITRGTGDHAVVSLRAECINIGRGPEVRDERNRLMRTNDVVFTEMPDGPNATVSRRHAHIQFDAASGEFRIYDDRSERGTGVVRSGRTISVPTGTRGLRLRSGDQLILGDGRVEISFLEQ